MADPSSTVSGALIGEIFVERGHITPAQLEEALATQAETGELLGEILVTRCNIPRVELAGVLAEQWATMERSGGVAPNEPIAAAAAAYTESTAPATVDVTSDVDFERRPIGEIFVEQGVVTQNELEAALAAQAESGQRLGEVLVAQGVITRLELASALADQWSTLQKIRPPEPKPAEAWQELVVRAAPTKDPATNQPSNHETSAEVEGLRDAVTALEERLRLVSATSAASAGPAPDEALRELGASFERQLEELAERLDATHTADVTAVREALDELREKVAQPADDTRIAALEQRLETAVDGLLARIESTTSEPGADAALEALQATIAGLEHRTAEAPTRDELDALRVAFAAVSEEVKGLSQTPGGVTHDELAQHLTRVATELGTRIDAITTNADSDAALADVHSRVAELADEVATLPRTTAAPSELTERLAGIVTRLDEAERQLTAIDELRSRIDQFHDTSGDSDTALTELDRRLAVVSDTVAELPTTERVSSLEESLAALPNADRVAALEAAIAELPELRSQLETIVTTPAGVSPADLAAVAARLDEFGARLDASATAEKIDELTRSLETVRTSEDSQIESLRTSVRELSDGLRELWTRPSGVSGEALERTVAALRGRLDELAEVQSSLSLRHADEVTQAQLDERLGSEQSARDELSHRLAELQGALADVASIAGADEVARQGVAEVRAQLDGIGTRIGEAASRELGELKERVSELAAAVTDDRLEGQVVELRSQLEPLTTKVDALAAESVRDTTLGQLGELREQIAELGVRVSETELPAVDLQPLSDRLESLATDYGTRLHQLEETNDRVDHLDRRLTELPPPAPDLTVELENLRTRLDELAGRPGGDETARQGVADLRAALATLAAEAGHDQTARDELSTVISRVESLEAAGSAKKAVSRLDDELDEHRTQVEGRFGEVWGKVAELDELRGRIDRLDAVTTDAIGRGEIDDVRGRLGELVVRLDSAAPSDWVAGIERTAADAVSSLQVRLDTLEERSATETASAHELAEARAALDALGQRLSALSRALEETQGNVVAIDGNVAATLQAAVKDMVSAATVAELAEQVHGRLASIEAAAAPTTAALDELGMRLGAAEQSAWALPEELDSRFDRLHSELSARIEELRNAQASNLVALQARLDEVVELDATRFAALENTTGYVSARLDGLEARLTGADGTVAERVDRLEERLDAEAKRAKEQGKQTEKAIRKGLAALADRLTANEDAYVESGKALRRAIERLGAAVIEADTRIAEMPLDAPEDGYVAFVPTGDGYRLRPLDGTVPAIGDVLDLGENGGQLRVSRIATSPLPLDRRACAYLERT